MKTRRPLDVIPRKRRGARVSGLMGALLLAMAAAGPARRVDAQQAPDAKALASRVQAFYEGVRTFQADFVQIYYYRLYDRYERSRGRVTFKKPDRMRWNYERPRGKVVVADGDRLRVFDPGGEQERPQLFVHRLGDHELPQVLSFLTAEEPLQRQFRLRVLDPRRYGYGGGRVLELRPKRNRTPRYERILLYVTSAQDGSAKTAPVRRVLVVDHAGNRNRFDFRNTELNGAVPNAHFRFSPPPRTRIVRP